MTGLNDKEGYSPLFDSGEKRQETLSSSFIQYSRPFVGFGPTANFMLICHTMVRTAQLIYSTLGALPQRLG